MRGADGRMVRLSEKLIRSLCTAQSYERGEEYYQNGAIINPAKVGNKLFAQCQGTAEYEVWAELQDHTIKAGCTCPYDWGGYCKHIVALLLHYLYEPQDFLEYPRLSEALAKEDKTTLLMLLDELGEEHPELYVWIDEKGYLAAAPTVTVAPPSSEASSLNEATWRAKIQKIFHPQNEEDYYGSCTRVANAIEKVVQEIYHFYERGEIHNALTLIRLLIEEYLDSGGEFDDQDYEIGGQVQEAVHVLGMIFLSNRPDEKTCTSWRDFLQPLLDIYEATNLGVEIELALLVLDYGEAPLPEELADMEFERARLRFDVLKFQKRYEEAIALARAHGLYFDLVSLLLELKRIPEALQVALTAPTAHAALALAKRFEEARYLQEAVQVAERGLDLLDGPQSITWWIAPLAEQTGRSDLAIRIYTMTMDKLPTLEVYQRLRALSPEASAKYRTVIIQSLKDTNNFRKLLELYLNEGMFEEARELAEAHQRDYDLQEIATKGLIEHDPAWVAQTCIRIAETFIARKQSHYYSRAVDWLERAKRAAFQANEIAAWEEYLAYLKKTYANRPVLLRELKRLG